MAPDLRHDLAVPAWRLNWTSVLKVTGPATTAQKRFSRFVPPDTLNPLLRSRQLRVTNFPSRRAWRRGPQARQIAAALPLRNHTDSSTGRFLTQPALASRRRRGLDQGWGASAILRNLNLAEWERRHSCRPWPEVNPRPTRMAALRKNPGCAPRAAEHAPVALAPSQSEPRGRIPGCPGPHPFRNSGSTPSKTHWRSRRSWAAPSPRLIRVETGTGASGPSWGADSTPAPRRLGG